MTKEEIEALAKDLERPPSCNVMRDAAAALRQLSESREREANVYAKNVEELIRFQMERESDRQYLRALLDTAQWNSEAKGNVADKAAWSSLAASIMAHQEKMNA